MPQALHLYRRICFKNRLLRDMPQNSDSLNNLPNNILSSRCSNWFVSIFRGLDSFCQCINRKHTTRRDVFLWKVIHLGLCVRLLEVQKHPELLLLCYFDIHTHSSPLLEANFLPASIKVSTVKKFWSQKLIDFVPCFGILQVGKWQKAANFEFLVLFPPTFLPFCWGFFLLQDFFLKRPVFDQYFNL